MRLLNSFNLAAAQKLNSEYSWACTISLTTCQVYSCCSECRKFSHSFRVGGLGVEGVVWLAFFFFVSKGNGYKENSSEIPWDQFTNC